MQESYEHAAGTAFTRSMAERASEPLDPELQPYFEEDCLTPGGALKLPALRHPLVYSVPHLPGMHWLANDQLRQKRASCREAIARRDWAAYVLMHERPYRPDALRHVINVLANQPLAPVDYWHLVTWTWRDSENIHQNLRQWRRLWLRSSYRSSRQLFAMSPEERSALAGMPDELRVHRGQSARHPPGMSWTNDRDRARWFAFRLRPEEPTVLSGRVRRENVLAYLMGRNESELVVLPEHVELDVPVATTGSAGD